MAEKRLRHKIPQLQRALEGELTEHHGFLLRRLLDQYDFFAKEIARISERLAAIAPPSFRAAVERLDEVAGVAERGAQALLAETGTDMSRFPSHKHFASWAGRCPGNRDLSRTVRHMEVHVRLLRTVKRSGPNAAVGRSGRHRGDRDATLSFIPT